MGLCCFAMPIKRLGMELFSSPHLLLLCPSSVAGYCGGWTSSPPCGLLELKDWDSIKPFKCRPRLGPRHKEEEILSERCVLLKNPMPSPPIIRQYWNTPIGC